MDIIQCEYCKKIQYDQDNSRLTTDEKERTQLFEHPKLMLLHSSSGWFETEELYYCHECHTVFRLDEYQAPGEDSPLQYWLSCLTENLDEERKIDDLRHVGRYLYDQEQAKKIQQKSMEDGYETLYMYTDIQKLKKIKSGKRLSCTQLCYTMDNAFFTFAGTSYMKNFYTRNYLIKIKVPNRSLYSNVEPWVGGLGSGGGGYNLKCSYKPALDDVEVYDINLYSFVPLEHWKIPSAFDIEDPMVDKIKEQYEPLRKKYQPMNEKLREQVEQRIRELTISIYGN